MGKLARLPKQEDLPGMARQAANDLKPRLTAKLSIEITDQKTGESIKRVVPFESDEPKLITQAFRIALSHPRLAGEIEAFVKGREGLNTKGEKDD